MDDTIKLVFQTDTAGMKVADDALKTTKANTADVAAAMDAATAATGRQRDALGRFVGGSGQAAAAAKQTATAVDGQAAAMDRAATSTDKATNKMAGSGQVMLQGSRAVQDFASQIQNGLGPALNGILNNIEGVARGFGLGPGVAGALTVAGVAASVAWPYIRDFVASMQADKVENFRDAIERTKDEIKKITEKEHKVALDFFSLDVAEARLKQLQDGLAAFNATAGLRSEAEQKSGQEVKKAIGEAPGGGKQATEDLRRPMFNKLVANDPAMREAEAEQVSLAAQLQKAKDDEEKAVGLPDLLSARASRDAAERSLQAAREKAAVRRHFLEAKAPEEVGKVLGPAEAGDAEAQQELRRMLREAGRGGLADEIGKVNPAAMAQKLAAEKAKKEGKAAADKAKHDAEKALHDFNKALDDRAEEFASARGGTNAMRDDFTPERVAKELVDAGKATAEEAARIAWEVHRRAVALAFKAVGKKKIDMGPDATLPEARDALIGKFDDSEEAKAGREEKKEAKPGEKLKKDQKKIDDDNARLRKQAEDRSRRRLAKALADPAAEAEARRLAAEAEAVRHATRNSGKRGEALRGQADQRLNDFLAQRYLADDPDLSVEQAEKWVWEDAPSLRPALERRGGNRAAAGPKPPPKGRGRKPPGVAMRDDGQKGGFASVGPSAPAEAAEAAGADATGPTAAAPIRVAVSLTVADVEAAVAKAVREAVGPITGTVGGVAAVNGQLVAVVGQIAAWCKQVDATNVAQQHQMNGMGRAILPR
jgi:hypothetical protein